MKRMIRINKKNTNEDMIKADNEKKKRKKERKKVNTKR